MILGLDPQELRMNWGRLRVNQHPAWLAISPSGQTNSAAIAAIAPVGYLHLRGAVMELVLQSLSIVTTSKMKLWQGSRARVS
jgi:hypothetical protein